MKIAIIYSGAFNFFETAIINQKKYLFDYLKKNNYEYDIYFNVSPQFYLKHPKKQSLQSVTEYLKEELSSTKLMKEYSHKLENNITKDTNGWFLNDIELSESYVNKIIETTGLQHKIKIKNIDKYIPLNDSLSTNIHKNYLNSDSYNRLKKTHNFIKSNKIKYDYFITLRPEIVFNNNFNFKELIENPKFYVDGNCRLDCMQMSKYFLPDLINDDIEKMVKNYSYGKECADENRFASFEPLFFVVISKLINIEIEKTYMCSKIDAVMICEYDIICSTFKDQCETKSFTHLNI